MSIIKPKDYYELVDEKHLNGGDRTYPNYDKVKISIPTRIIFNGAPGTKKSNTLYSLIENMDCFDKIYIYACELDQPLYNGMRELLDDFYEKKTMTKKYDETTLIMSNDIDDVPELKEFDKDVNNLVIIDDFLELADTKNVRKLFSQSRNHNITVIFISQSYFEIPKFIRGCTQFLLLKRIVEEDDLTRILSKYEKKKLDLVKLAYHKTIDKSINNWFMIDSRGDPELKYRVNFEPIKI